jgi:hypothetical protein
MPAPLVPAALLFSLGAGGDRNRIAFLVLHCQKSTRRLTFRNLVVLDVPNEYDENRYDRQEIVDTLHRVLLLSATEFRAVALCTEAGMRMPQIAAK